MPGPARLITLNLGSQTVGVAEFRVAHGGLVLVNYRLHEVPIDPETGHRRDARDARSPAPGELCFACAISVRPVCETAAVGTGKTGQDHLVRSAAKCPVP